MKQQTQPKKPPRLRLTRGERAWLEAVRQEREEREAKEQAARERAWRKFCAWD